MTDLDLINFLEWLDAGQHLLAAPAGDRRTLEDIAHAYLEQAH
ncbi:hypothetical protein [Propionibacterium acidifaciens]|mgnify:FL=1|nr:hypothetical protein [Propionibacterium acidifaciens]